MQELSRITRGLKALAKELMVPVLVLSQLSRAVESRSDKRPQLADLRESGCLAGDTRVRTWIAARSGGWSNWQPCRLQQNCRACLASMGAGGWCPNSQ